MTEFLKYPGESSNDHLPPEGKALAHSRRVFLFKLSLALNAAIGAVLAVPLVGYLFGPIVRKSENEGSWISLGSADSFTIGDITLSEFQSPVTRLGDGETGKVVC